MRAILCFIVLNFATASSLADEAKVRVGDTFPHFSLPEVGSRKIFDSKSLNGKIVVVDFWGSDCPPCREAVPELNKLAQEFKLKPVVIIGINVDESEKDTKAFLAEFKPRYRLVDDSKHKFVPKMGFEMMPTTYVLDRNHVVRYINEGFRTGDTEKLRKAISKALGATSK